MHRMHYSERYSTSATVPRVTHPAGTLLHEYPTHTARALLEHAIDVIDAYGEAALRMHDLARRVGVAVTSIYHFFGSREGLIEAAHAQRYARCLQRELTVFASATRRCRSRGQFEALVRTTLEQWGSSHHSVTRMTMTSAVGGAHGRPRLAAALAEIHHDGIGVLVDTLRRPQERGWISPQLDLATFAAWFLALLLQRAPLDVASARTDPRPWIDLSTSATMGLLLGQPERATLIG